LADLDVTSTAHTATVPSEEPAAIINLSLSLLPLLLFLLLLLLLSIFILAGDDSTVYETQRTGDCNPRISKTAFCAVSLLSMIGNIWPSGAPLEPLSVIGWSVFEVKHRNLTIPSEDPVRKNFVLSKD
jgi:hypothetical protein